LTSPGFRLRCLPTGASASTTLGTGADQHHGGIGNASDNQLTGNAIGNYLLGGLGDDVLFGEGGADRFVFEIGGGDDLAVLRGVLMSQLTESDFNRNWRPRRPRRRWWRSPSPLPSSQAAPLSDRWAGSRKCCPTSRQVHRNGARAVLILFMIFRLAHRACRPASSQICQ
jgi:hypothetical protein